MKPSRPQPDIDVEAILRKLASDPSLDVLTSENGRELAITEQQIDEDRRARARRDFARKLAR